VRLLVYKLAEYPAQAQRVQAILFLHPKGIAVLLEKVRAHRSSGYQFEVVSYISKQP
jgi:hypothetical protein